MKPREKEVVLGQTLVAGEADTLLVISFKVALL